MSDIKITIGGECASGKSSILYILREFLQGNGFDVDQEFNTDHPTKENFDNIIGDNLVDAIDNIRSKTKITLSEVQFNRQ
tara:strand:- start:33358 stop:33597 length:240 start_codon:yes stop_codon:yes gene_type:complete